jgi:crossover junction endodeoxyribonuclease RuvC
MQDYQPSEMAIEELYFSKNEKTALLVAQARGVILLSAAQSKLSISTYNPLYVKQTICGNGHADKKQIQAMVKLTLKLKQTPEPDDVADAIALAITHAMSYTLGTHKHD